jgi:YVTN family beta-propeller protein
MRNHLALIVLLAVALLGGCDSSTGPVHRVGPAGKLYVPNQADSTMYIYDTETMSRIDSFHIPIAEPHYIDFSHDLAYYYVVGRQAGGKLVKYQSSNDSVISVVQVPGAVFPTAFVISNDDDTLYLTDFTLGSGHTHRYDVSGTNFQWHDSVLQAGIQVHDIRISPDGRRIVSAGFSSDDITIYDLLTGDVQPLTIDSARHGFNPVSNNYGPSGVLIDRNGTRAVLACSKGTDQLRLVDLVNLTIVDSILIPVSNTINPDRNGPTYMVISPDNNVVFVTNHLDNSMSVVRLSTLEVLTTIPFETPRPFGIAMSDDGTRVYVSCTNIRPAKGKVYVIDGEKYTKIDSVEVGSEPYGLAWRPL